MKKRVIYLPILLLLLIVACKEEEKGIHPEYSDITESLYASGTIKSKGQYNVFTKASGVVEKVFVEAGEKINKGDSIILIDDDLQEINKKNAALSSQYYASSNNKDQLANLENSIRIAKKKKEFDSLQYERQKRLDEKGVGISVELEMSKLNFENSLLNYRTAVNQLQEFKRQLKYNESQALNNLQLTKINKQDFLVTSEMDGILFSLDCSEGELVSPQRPIAVIGAADQFLLEMFIDETDILEVHIGQEVIVRLDSYKDTVFVATVSKIYPLMDIQSKSFKVEAIFKTSPKVVYPNMNFEANIIINKKEKALIIPREYLIGENKVRLQNGDEVEVKIGLSDYKKVEILEGLTESDVIVLPEE